MGRKCEFYWCGNQQGTGVSFYQFPQDSELCQAWVERCNSSEASKAFTLMGPQAFRNKRICSDHFPFDAFKEPTRKEKGLIANAVPSMCSNQLVGNEEYLCEPLNASGGFAYQLSNEESVEFIQGDLDYMEWKRYTEPSIGTYCCSQTAGRSRNDCLHDSTSSSIRSQVTHNEHQVTKFSNILAIRQEIKAGMVTGRLIRSNHCQTYWKTAVPVNLEKERGPVNFTCSSILTCMSLYSICLSCFYCSFFFNRSSSQRPNEELEEFIQGDMDYMEWKRSTEPSIGVYCCSRKAGRSQSDWLDDTTFSSIRPDFDTRRVTEDQAIGHHPIGESTNNHSTQYGWSAHPIEPKSNISDGCSTGKLEEEAATGNHEMLRLASTDVTVSLQIDHLSSDFQTTMHQSPSSGNHWFANCSSAHMPPFTSTPCSAVDCVDPRSREARSAITTINQPPNHSHEMENKLWINASGDNVANTLGETQTFFNLSDSHGCKRPETENQIQFENTPTCSSNPSTVDTELKNSLNLSAVAHAESFKAQLKVQSEIIKNMKEQLRHAKRKLFVSQQAGKRRLKGALNAKKENRTLKKELKTIRKLKSENEALGAQVRNNPVILDVLKNSSRKPKGRRYNASTMKFAAGTYLSGPRAYRYVRNSKHVILPHKSTIYKHNQHVRIQAGMNSSLLASIRKKVREITKKKNKLVTLTCDGMLIKKDLSYSAKADIFHGFPDDGIRRRIERNDPNVLATEAVVVMASGMYLNFKQPIGYYLAHNSLGSDGLFKLLKASIRTVGKCGLNPLLITMDQCSTNVKMVREHQASADPPTITVDDREVLIMYDTPHLLKNTRNSIFKHNAVFGEKIASHKHIRNLYDIDVTSSLRIVPNCKRKISISHHLQR
nr:uncharacterized protein LOC115255249 [Aedes albopictus]